MWLNAAEKIAVTEVAQRLGLQSLKGNSFGPCFNCGALYRGSKDKRGTIGIRTDNKGWKCHRCDAGGSGIDLVSFSVGGGKFSQLDQLNKKKVQVWFEGEISDGAPVTESIPKLRGSRPPIVEVQNLWKSSLKLNQVKSDDTAISFLKSRNLNLGALSKSGVGGRPAEVSCGELLSQLSMSSVSLLVCMREPSRLLTLLQKRCGLKDSKLKVSSCRTGTPSKCFAEKLRI